MPDLATINCRVCGYYFVPHDSQCPRCGSIIVKSPDATAQEKFTPDIKAAADEAVAFAQEASGHLG